MAWSLKKKKKKGSIKQERFLFSCRVLLHFHYTTNTWTKWVNLNAWHCTNYDDHKCSYRQRKAGAIAIIIVLDSKCTMLSTVFQRMSSRSTEATKWRHQTSGVICTVDSMARQHPNLALSLWGCGCTADRVYGQPGVTSKDWTDLCAVCLHFASLGDKSHHCINVPNNLFGVVEVEGTSRGCNLKR